MAANLNIVLATDDETSQYVLVSLSRAVTAAYWSAVRHFSGDAESRLAEQLAGTFAMLEDILGKVPHGSILVQVPQSVVDGVNALAASGQAEVYTRWNRLLSYGAVIVVSDDEWRSLPNVNLGEVPAGLNALGGHGLGLAPVALVAIVVICVTVVVSAVAVAYALTQISRDAFFARNAWHDCVIANKGDASRCGDKPTDVDSPWGAFGNLGTAATVVAVVAGGAALVWFLAPYIKGALAARDARRALPSAGEVP